MLAERPVVGSENLTHSTFTVWTRSGQTVHDGTIAAVAPENSIRLSGGLYFIGMVRQSLLGRAKFPVLLPKIPCYGSKNSLFHCVGNFSARSLLSVN
jgi:hypothetical protein